MLNLDHTTDDIKDSSGASIFRKLANRVNSVASSASPTFSVNSYDMYKVTAQTEAINFANANLTGTPTDGQLLILSIASSTTVARAITYDTNFISTTTVLPTTTSATTLPITITLQWDSSYAGGKWLCKGVT